jgi:hypothetical protein
MTQEERSFFPFSAAIARFQVSVVVGFLTIPPGETNFAHGSAVDSPDRNRFHRGDRIVDWVYLPDDDAGLKSAFAI